MLLERKKNSRENSDEALGRSRGGFTSKIHCIVDGLGNPVDFILTGGQVHDSVCAIGLLENKEADFVVADKAYDASFILEKIEEMKAIAVIPPRTNRKEKRNYDKHFYKDRNLVERFFVD